MNGLAAVQIIDYFLSHDDERALDMGGRYQKARMLYTHFFWGSYLDIRFPGLRIRLVGPARPNPEPEA